MPRTALAGTRSAEKPSERRNAEKSSMRCGPSGSRTCSKTLGPSSHSRRLAKSCVLDGESYNT